MLLKVAGLSTLLGKLGDFVPPPLPPILTELYNDLAIFASRLSGWRNLNRLEFLTL